MYSSRGSYSRPLLTVCRHELPPSASILDCTSVPLPSRCGFHHARLALLIVTRVPDFGSQITHLSSLSLISGGSASRPRRSTIMCFVQEDSVSERANRQPQCGNGSTRLFPKPLLQKLYQLSHRDQGLRATENLKAQPQASSPILCLLFLATYGYPRLLTFVNGRSGARNDCKAVQNPLPTCLWSAAVH